MCIYSEEILCWQHCPNVTNNSAKTFIYWADCQSEDPSEWIREEDEQMYRKSEIGWEKHQINLQICHKACKAFLLYKVEEMLPNIAVFHLYFSFHWVCLSVFLTIDFQLNKPACNQLSMHTVSQPLRSITDQCNMLWTAAILCRQTDANTKIHPNYSRKSVCLEKSLTTKHHFEKLSANRKAIQCSHFLFPFKNTVTLHKKRLHQVWVYGKFRFNDKVYPTV